MLPNSLKKLIDSFAKLPGVGRKTAQRYAYFVLRNHRGLAKDLGESLMKIGDVVRLCTRCYMLTDNALCTVCSNPRRDHQVICVVEHVFDAEAIERSNDFHGVYHILHGRIAPLDNILPDDIKVRELIARIEALVLEGLTVEVILATNPNSEGDTTALYIHNLLKPLGIKVTRIATGIPVGADLEYADEITLSRALKGRQDYE